MPPQDWDRLSQSMLFVCVLVFGFLLFDCFLRFWFAHLWRCSLQALHLHNSLKALPNACSIATETGHNTCGPVLKQWRCPFCLLLTIGKLLLPLFNSFIADTTGLQSDMVI